MLVATLLQNNVSLSFENVERVIKEEKIMIKNVIEIAKHNLDEEENRFKKVDRNLLKDWVIKVNHILKEVKSGDITETIRIKACVIFVGKSRPQTKPKKRKCSERTPVKRGNKTVNTRVIETY